ncbi:uncharacterized protein conserved in archaea [Anaerolinea thermolimosa]|nr:DUF1786 domain-containing protein [Anaerolinea thermolimosa]GAP07283.1 uncharacterized protein conserved in archaea [Anaerolinea thermolimosa]
MKILVVDIGTGTQDIVLFDSRLDVENAYKLVLPSPTMIIRRRIQQATREHRPLLMTGLLMGGGPCAWAVEDHLKAGLPVLATPEAARTLNDDLNEVSALGVKIIGDEEVAGVMGKAAHVEMRDFDFGAIRRAFWEFGVALDDLAAVAVGVFDHGAAPPGVSDRQFRFDYLNDRIRAENRLTAFAYPAEHIPPILTRLQAVARSAREVDTRLVVMDTAPAAVLGAMFNVQVSGLERVVVTNVGNFHTLAFRMGPGGIEGVFEHHTGLMDRERLEALLEALADGSLTHADVFGSMGHGALVYDPRPFDLHGEGIRLVVTGPRRALLRGSKLRPWFAAPFGDMMIAGCFGLLAGVADCFPDLREPIFSALYQQTGNGKEVAPWDVPL